MCEMTVSWPKKAEPTEHELRVELVMEKQRCGALIAENERLRVEIDRLRGVNKANLDRNMKAYDAYLRANADDKARFPMRLALYMALPLIALFAGSALTLLICLGRVL